MMLEEENRIEIEGWRGHRLNRRLLKCVCAAICGIYVSNGCGFSLNKTTEDKSSLLTKQELVANAQIFRTKMFFLIDFILHLNFLLFNFSKICLTF